MADAKKDVAELDAVKAENAELRAQIAALAPAPPKPPAKPAAVVIRGTDLGPPGTLLAQGAISISRKNTDHTGYAGKTFPANGWLPASFPKEIAVANLKRDPGLIWDEKSGVPYPGPRTQ